MYVIIPFVAMCNSHSNQHKLKKTEILFACNPFSLSKKPEQI